MGEKGGRVEGGEGEEEKDEEEGNRKSKDKVINTDGRKMIDFLEEKGWSILNGDVKGDEERKWTFTGGRGNTVIDYVIGNEESREKVKKLWTGDKVDSDHHPIEVEIEIETEEEGKERRERQKGGGRGAWNEERRKVFREKIGEIGKGKGEIEEEWERMEEKLKKAM